MREVLSDRDLEIHEIPGEGHVIIPKKNHSKWHKILSYAPGVLGLGAAAAMSKAHPKEAAMAGVIGLGALGAGAANHYQINRDDDRRDAIREAIQNAPKFRRHSARKKKVVLSDPSYAVDLGYHPEKGYYFIPKGNREAWEHIAAHAKHAQNFVDDLRKPKSERRGFVQHIADAAETEGELARSNRDREMGRKAIEQLYGERKSDSSVRGICAMIDIKAAMSPKLKSLLKKLSV